MPNLLFTALLGAQLLYLAIYDARHMRIPDLVNLTLALTGAAAVWFLGEIGVRDALGGLFLGLGLFASLRYGYFALRGQHGLGLGDVKLAAAAGILTGFRGFFPFVLLSCLAALGFILVTSIARGKPPGGNDRLPFGPFMAAGLFAWWLARPWLEPLLW